jgi:DNA polymerase III epsilon subunit-like protein
VAESCGLDWLTQYFDLRNPARHRAGGDAWATAELLLKLLDLARAEGARTFADLEALQQRKRRGKRRKKSAMPGPIQGEARAL